MRTINLIIIILLSFVWACNLISSDQKGAFAHQFDTYKKVYTLQDTVKATFINQSGQRIFIRYQGCTIAGMQKLEGRTWKSIPIPVTCVAIVKSPVPVDPGGALKVGIELPFFNENTFQAGSYRLNVFASYGNGDKSKELTSNSFKITK